MTRTWMGGRSMTTRRAIESLSLFVIVLLFGILFCGVIQVSLAEPAAPPDPLPDECGGIIGPGGACCIFGYIYYLDQPQANVVVTIESALGMTTTLTAGESSSGHPFFSANLSDAPLAVLPGDMITITAIDGDMASARTWVVQEGGQQVDLGTIAGYQPPNASLASTNKPVSNGKGATREPRVLVADTASSTNALQHISITADPPTCLVRLNEVPTDYTSVQAAVDASSHPTDVVKVAGYCTGIQSRSAVTQVVYISKTVTIRGGYTADFNEPPDAKANPTILDAQGQGRVLYISGNISPTVEGLNITGGDAATAGGSWVGIPTTDLGGGVYIITATATLSNAKIYSNTAAMGGGLFLYRSASAINASIITTNTADIHGGGLHLIRSTAKVEDNLIAANAAGGVGGGLSTDQGQTIVGGNRILNNQALGGGGLYLSGGPHIIESNIISGNSAGHVGNPGSGGGLHLAAAEVTLINNAVAQNTTWPGFGDGLSVTSSSVRLLHTTLDGDSIYMDPQVPYSNVAVLTNTILNNGWIEVCPDTEVRLEATLWSGDSGVSGGGTIITGNLNYWGEAAFQGGRDRWHIMSGSAALDRGIDAGITTDIDGQIRPYGIGYDIGADEHWPEFEDSGISNLPAIGSSSAAWGDYDGDGDLDLLLAGFDGTSTLSRLYRNDDKGVFSYVPAGLAPARDGSVDWGDYDNDNDLDITLTGFGTVHEAKVYRNEAGGGFTDIGASLVGVTESSATWGDYDNDGDLDILLTGYGGGYNTEVYRNDGEGIFVDIDATLAAVDRGSADWGDYDNDGDLDILLSGATSSGRISKVYRNDGAGIFVDINAPLIGVHDSAIEWGNYDNDNDLDILITGCAVGDCTAPVAAIYRNDNGNFVDIGASLAGVYDGSVAWGDYDNDGDLDILETGQTSDGAYITKVYRNDAGGDIFNMALSLPGVYMSSAEWGDYDKDGKLDFVLTGIGDSGYVTRIYRNTTPTANHRPIAPIGQRTTVSDTRVTLAWDTSADHETPSARLSYNVRVGTAPGLSDIVSPMACLDSSNCGGDGYRQVTRLGNTQLLTYRTIENLATGTYYWSVQTIDTAAAGSSFSAEKSFRIGEATPPVGVTIAGPLDGMINTSYTFTATVSPVTATTPISYIWRATAQPPVTHTRGLSDTTGFTWTLPGNQIITVTASNERNTVTDTLAILIVDSEYEAPSADFSAVSVAGSSPLNTSFLDESTGDLTSWDWTFGDGHISGARHAAHIFDPPGAFTVSLTVRGPGGSDSEMKTAYITVFPSPPLAAIESIWPSWTTQGQDLIYFDGWSQDSDENGDYVVSRRWSSSIDGRLSSDEDWTIEASALSPGTHIITYTVQDDETEWSWPATQTLTIDPPPSTMILTMILFNSNAYTTTQMVNKLHEMASHDTVRGLVVDLWDFPGVQDAYNAWYGDPFSSEKANNVTAAIKAVVDTLWIDHDYLQYLVIIGTDQAIPFRRVFDQSYWQEWHYQPQVSCSSVTGAAICDNRILTDDYYGDRIPSVPVHSDWDGHALYIPDLGVGRLVGTADEIIAQIDAYLENGGEILAGDAIVAGYESLADSAQAIQVELARDSISLDSLIGEDWGRDDYIEHVRDTRHAICSSNTHATHEAIGTPIGSVTASDWTGAAITHTETVIYTPGCHAGLDYSPLNLTHALIHNQVNYVANTGYGFGDRHFVRLSEQLMLNFTKRLIYGESATVGKALAAAKHEYYLDEAWFDYNDEKVMIELTLYGLPMFRYRTPHPSEPGTEGLPGSISQAPRTPQTRTRLASFSGLSIMPINVKFSAFTLETTPDGQYYTNNGLVHTEEGKPTQPMTIIDISHPFMDTKGVVLTGGEYRDIQSFSTVAAQAITLTLGTSKPAPKFHTDGWYPAFPAQVVTLGDVDSMIAVAGQMQSASLTERLYSRLRFDVYYQDGSNDWTPPNIIAITSTLVNDHAIISVRTYDASDIETVVVAYTANDGLWNSIALVETEGTWSAQFPAGDNTVFFVQAVDQAGNVTVEHNSGHYFRPGEGLSKRSIAYLPLVVKNR